MRCVLLGNVELPYSSETYYVKTLREMGHEVVTLHETKATGEDVEAACQDAELFVWIHGHSDETPGKPMEEVLKNIDIPTITWHHDLFLGLGRENLITEAPVYNLLDRFYTTDKLMADKVGGYYLPSAVYGGEAVMLPKRFNVPEVSFVGNKGYHPEWPYRPQLINWLSDTYKDKFGWYSGEVDSLGLKRGLDMNQLFADTKVVVGDSLCLNFDYPYYWSDRVWETLGRGGFLIMPFVKGMDDYFEDGKHLVFYKYGDFAELKSKIDFYLANNEARDYIRKQGHELVKNNHTYKQRWEVILNDLSLGA